MDSRLWKVTELNLDTLILGLRRHISPTRIQYWAQVWLAEEEDFKGILQHAAFSKKRCESNKTTLYLCVCRRKGVVSIRECETENWCVFLSLSVGGPWSLAGIFRSLKEHSHIAHGPKKQNKAKKKHVKNKEKKKLLKTRAVHENPASCFPLIFTAGHAGLEFIFCAKTKLYSACVTRSTNQITAAVERGCTSTDTSHQMTPSGVGVMSRPPVQVQASSVQVCLEFDSTKKKRKRETLLEGRDLMMLVRWFWDTFCAHFTSRPKRPSVKGLQGTGMSKYPHHHRRLQVSGHVSVSAPPPLPINTSVPLN